MNSYYPAFSSFRELMTKWDDVREDMERETKVKTIIDGQNLILFFKKGKDLFGAPEESRLTFARMRDKEENLEDARFIAINLIDALSGKTTQNLFNHEDIKKIKILDKDHCSDLLMKYKIKGKPVVVKNIGKLQGDDDGLMPVEEK